MKYSKEITIRQIIFKYNITRLQAENMYKEFEQSDNTDILESVVFGSNGEYNSETTALSY